MGNTKNLWYAVNGSGQGVIFTSCPSRNQHYRCWEGEIIGLFCSLVAQFESEMLIELPAMTWENEPIEIGVSMILK